MLKLELYDRLPSKENPKKLPRGHYRLVLRNNLRGKQRNAVCIPIDLSQTGADFDVAIKAIIGELRFEIKERRKIKRLTLAIR